MKRPAVIAGYVAIALVGGGLALAVHDYGVRDQNEALEHYVATQHAAAQTVVDRAESAINSIYENLRTLSLLPGTRGIARHGENLSAEARLTFQQLYNNLANAVSVSEVYILPADLDPDRVDPVTGKLEEPILMFDQLIVDARDRYEADNPTSLLPKVSDPGYQAEVEVYEYREMRSQLARLKDKYPTLSAIRGLDIPLLGSPELITCDNTNFIHTLNDADRSGVVFTVPFYGPDEQLRGAVSAIILTSALQALLPSADYALINVGQKYTTSLAGSGQRALSAPDVRQGKPDTSLLYSEVLPLKTANADSSYALWVGHPDDAFYSSPDAAGVRQTVGSGYAMIAVLVVAAMAVWFLVTRNLRAAARMSSVLEKRVAERTAEIRFVATHDALTGLANRASLTERLDEMLQLENRSNTSLAVLVVDLDNFKTINDTLGHHAGDAILKTFAERLRFAVGEDDMPARFGGDEFVLVHKNATQSSSEALARRLLACTAAPYDINGQPYSIGLSIGIALAPTDGRDSTTLIRNADIALYRAKGEGRATFRFFAAEMDAALRQRQSLEKELRRAVEREEFVVYYQPLVSASDGVVTGFEALVRWEHPERGLVPPSEFIPLAEDIGLIDTIGRWVLLKACTEAATWPDPLKVAVNISAVQFRQKTLAHSVVEALDSSGLAPRRLELEITETALVADTPAALAILHQVKSLGVQIAMDDFGTGFSSLSYLRSFPFDRIKIDRSFVSEIIDNNDCRAIVSAVAALGQSLGMTTTAEGIETAEQLQLAKVEGCTDLQGYLFSKPMPSGYVQRFLEASQGPKSRDQLVA